MYGYSAQLLEEEIGRWEAAQDMMKLDPEIKRG